MWTHVCVCSFDVPALKDVTHEWTTVTVPPESRSLSSSERVCHGCGFAAGVWPLFIAAPAPRLSHACCLFQSAPVAVSDLAPGSPVFASPALHF